MGEDLLAGCREGAGQMQSLGLRDGAGIRVR